MNPTPFARRYAFELGRAVNEFHWAVVNVVVGGIKGGASLEVFDRLASLAEALATGWLSNVRGDLDEYRGDWRDYLAMDGDWEQVYEEALTIYKEDDFPGSTPTFRVLAYLWSFVAKFRSDLDQLVQRALMLSGDAVKAAYALGLTLDQGVRPPVAIAVNEVAAELGYVAPGPPLRLTTLRDFIRETETQVHAAWRKRRTASAKQHGAGAPFDEPEPPAKAPAPYARKAGELPPTSSWTRTLQIYWERIGLDRHRPLPDDLGSIAEAAPTSRVARVDHLTLLANEAFDEMRTASRNVGRDAPASPAGDDESSEMVIRQWSAKLTGCTAAEKRVFLQYKLAAAELSYSPSDGRIPTDRVAYEWLKAQDREGPLWALSLAFDTWVRYLRKARKLVGESKNRPRRGRRGRSIVGPDGDSPGDDP